MNDINALVHGSVSVWDLLHSTEMMGFYKTFLAQSSASARDFPVTPDEVSMEQDEEEDNLPEVEPGPPLVSELRLDEVFGAVSSRAQKPKEPSQNISGSAIPHQGPVSDDVTYCRDLIKDAITREDGKGPKEDAYQCLVGNVDDATWEESFRGNAHCEACLACEMMKGPITRQNNSIGTSKRCCAPCTWFLEALNPSIRYSAAHGKIYPWAVPTIDIDPEIKSVAAQHVLSKLKLHLRISLAQCRADAMDKAFILREKAYVDVEIPRIETPMSQRDIDFLKTLKERLGQEILG
ncbi:hypothetical protein FRB94_009503 [Tulasnella sp. JGI-2019a]|nr:hypothetical protein FRB94_009503 [Tulasnella sp. JGI-2019a]